MDTQLNTTKSHRVEQLDFLDGTSTPKASLKEPDLAYLMSLPNARRALRYSLSLADLEPKQVYPLLGKDKATWSRYEAGNIDFPVTLIQPLKTIVQNDAVLLWLNHQSGWDIRSMKRLCDDKDRRIHELEAQLAKERHERAIETKFVRENLL